MKSMTEVLKETNFDFLGRKKHGKVRDIYEQKDRLIIITTDRHSSFDRIIAHVPHKGQVLNQISLWWFEQTKDIVPNHVIASPDPNVTVAKKCTPVSIEAVMRGYLTGVTDTAIWTRYQAGQRGFGDIELPHGMTKNQKLPHPIFDPTTKEDGHDRPISPQDLVAEGFVTQQIFDQIKDTAHKLFTRGEELAAKRGLILVDTKYEFGIDPSTSFDGAQDKSLGASDPGQLVLIDEIHTPDSSRWWFADANGEPKLGQPARTADSVQSARTSHSDGSGGEPEYFDKEFLRLWFKEHSDPYKDEKLPGAPQEMVEELSRRYIQMYEQMTGAKFEPGAEPIIERMDKNLRPFAF